jgi:N-acetylneuraminic acid mutarotase
VVQRVALSGASATMARLPLARADLAAVEVGGQVLVVGGGTPVRYDRNILATSDGRRFRTIGSLRIGVRYPAVAAFDGRLFVVGGSTPSGDTREIQVIDPTTGAVSIAGRLPFGLSHASALVVDGELLVAGGRRAGVAQARVWRLDIGSDGRVTATRIGQLPYPISDAAAVVVDGTGYLLGGEGRQVGVPVDSVVRLGPR